MFLRRGDIWKILIFIHLKLSFDYDLLYFDSVLLLHPASAGGVYCAKTARGRSVLHHCWGKNTTQNSPLLIILRLLCDSA